MALTHQDIAVLSRLLDEGLDLDSDAFDTWIATLPTQHGHLAGHLRDMLKEGRAAARLPTLPRVDTVDGVMGHLCGGMSIGPYRLVRKLGTGGMGVVWHAHRGESGFQRSLALKLPILQGRSDSIALRFERECRILARLAHPYIARLHDAGVSAEGYPYLAMEYVAGEPVTEWCWVRNASL